VAFTGAGISVESGIPPFRGENGLWNTYDPARFDIEYFTANPFDSWQLIREIFYDSFGSAKPNKAHKVLAAMEHNGFLDGIITQNIDALHRIAGSNTIHEIHGSVSRVLCLSCYSRIPVDDISLDTLPPTCESCGGILKPDIVFFGEQVAEPAATDSFQAVEQAQILIIIGTTGEVMPAGLIPLHAKKHGAKVIEINTKPSSFTGEITDIYLQGTAGEVMAEIAGLLGLTLT
jgi:NAD-dependent deacetylase